MTPLAAIPPTPFAVRIPPIAVPVIPIATAPISAVPVATIPIAAIPVTSTPALAAPRTHSGASSRRAEITTSAKMPTTMAATAARRSCDQWGSQCYGNKATQGKYKF
jgi:hypothetical protein